MTFSVHCSFGQVAPPRNRDVGASSPRATSDCILIQPTRLAGGPDPAPRPLRSELYRQRFSNGAALSAGFDGEFVPSATCSAPRACDYARQRHASSGRPFSDRQNAEAGEMHVEKLVDLLAQHLRRHGDHALFEAQRDDAVHGGKQRT